MQDIKAGPAKYIGAWLMIVVGVVIAFASLSATSAPVVFLADVVFWPIDSAQTLTPESQLLAGVLGGVMVGWGTLFHLLISKAYPREPQLVRTMILGSVWAWFIVDGLGSAAAGAPLNIVLNVGFLLAFLLPWRQVASSTA